MLIFNTDFVFLNTDFFSQHRFENKHRFQNSHPCTCIHVFLFVHTDFVSLNTVFSTYTWFQSIQMYPVAVYPAVYSSTTAVNLVGTYTYCSRPWRVCVHICTCYILYLVNVRLYRYVLLYYRWLWLWFEILRDDYAFFDGPR